MILLRVFINLLVLSMLCVISNINAQISNELAIELPEIIIRDSNSIALNRHLKSLNKISDQYHLDEIFKNNGLVIKSHGPGQLASLSLRGTYASTHQVQWEGIDINDPLVGSMDMSQFKSSRNDNISIQHHGLGVLGSVINLSNNPRVDSSSNVYALINYLQYSDRRLSAGLHLNKLNVFTSSEFYSSSAKNDFKYNYQDDVLQRTHSQTRSKNFKHSTDFQHKKNLFGLRIWLSNSDRNIPPTLGALSSDASQFNSSNNFSISWKQIRNKDHIVIQTAYINQKVQYIDTSLMINFQGLSNQLVSKLKYDRYFASWVFKNQFVYKYITAKSTGYSEFISDPQISYLASLNGDLISQKYRISFYGKLNYAFNELQSITYGWNSIWKIKKGLSLTSVIERIGQIPSFNDLYWVPGGNTDIVPALGWGSELNFDWHTNNIRGIGIQFFNKNIQNQIIWLPNNAMFSVVNIPKTWSRGLSINMFNNQIFQSAWSFIANYYFTRSTYQKARIPNDDIIGKQLIFIPIHQFNTTLTYEMNKWSFSLSNFWSGKRYTSSDNSSFLNAYNLVDVYINRKVAINNGIESQIKLGMINILNTDYQLQNGWPMPGRQFLLQINFQLNNL